MPRHKNPIHTPVRDLVPQHRFPVASSLTHPQTASSALKSGLKPGRFTSPGFRPGIRRYSRTASPLLSLPKGRRSVAPNDVQRPGLPWSQLSQEHRRRF